VYNRKVSGADPRRVTRVLVGYDGSPVARAAVAYALERVGESGEVIAVYVVPPPQRQWAGTPYAEASLERHRQLGREVMEALAGQTAGLPLATELAEGPAAATLVALAEERQAEEIVVGSRGYGPVRAMLGSVSHALLHEMDRPVVVVPAALLGGPPSGRSGRVVVGYDGSPTAKDALAHAAYRAGPGGRLVVVYAFDPPRGSWPTPMAVQASADSRKLGAQLLEEIADEWPGGLPLERVLREGPAAGALVQSAREHDVDEIVVGSRGLGRFRAALGSVSHALVHEAEHPVVLVPQSPVAEQEESDRRAQRPVWVRRLPWPG
jgi:nucleotide-binding universal stress UspA family protein